MGSAMTTGHNCVHGTIAMGLAMADAGTVTEPLGLVPSAPCLRPADTIPPEIISNDFGFFELFSRFEFAFRHCERFFLNDSNFCSKFNHMQRDCTCACAVARLHPHNSISNVVVSLIIHDKKKYIYIRDVAKKNMKPLWKVTGFFNRTSWKVSDAHR